MTSLSSKLQNVMALCPAANPMPDIREGEVERCPESVSWLRNGRESNPQPLDCMSDALAITPANYPAHMLLHDIS